MYGIVLILDKNRLYKFQHGSCIGMLHVYPICEDDDDDDDDDDYVE